MKQASPQSQQVSGKQEGAIVCAIYTRVSTQSQVEDGLSLEAQRKRLIESADYHRWQVFGFYEDAGFTGRDTERPSLKRMLTDASLHKFNKVLIFKLDRLSRSVRDFSNMQKELEDYEVSISSVDLDLNTETASGKLTVSVLAAFAEFESDLIKERTQLSLADCRRKGQLLGRPPYGYFRRANGVIVAEASKLRIVRLIFDKYLAGMGQWAIAEDLREHDHDVSRDIVRDVLSNPVYAGKIAYGRRKPAGRPHNKRYAPVKPLAEWPELQDIAEKNVRAVISLEEWKKVQSIREGSPRHRKSESSALFQGLLHCSRCQRFLSVHTSEEKGTKYACDNDHGMLTRLLSGSGGSLQAGNGRSFCGQQLWEKYLEGPIVVALDSAIKNFEPTLRLAQEEKDTQRRLDIAEKTLATTKRRATSNLKITDAQATDLIESAMRSVDEYKLRLKQLKEGAGLETYVKKTLGTRFGPYYYENLTRAERQEILHRLIRRIDVGKSILTIRWAFGVGNKTKIERRSVMPIKGGHVKFMEGSPWSEGKAKSEDDSDVVLGVPRSSKKEKTGFNNNEWAGDKCEEGSKKTSMCSCDEASEVVEIGGLEPPTSCMPCRRSPS